jgi:N-acetyltransferase
MADAALRASDQIEPTIGPVTLAGRYVRLVPLEMAQLPDLTRAGADASIWQWYSVTGATPETMRAFVREALEARDRGAAVPCTVTIADTGQVVGMTRFGSIERRHRRAEIGWTWLSPSVQRTPVNSEMKYLMLRQAFESWRLMRVEFKTDSLNAKSRGALARIGATFEGIHRNHMITHTGRVRHSAWYSVTDGDWPQVKSALEGKLARPWSPRT